jgi:hypothetical protein
MHTFVVFGGTKMVLQAIHQGNQILAGDVAAFPAFQTQH